ncbi:SRPBCC family protein [Corallococcus sp. AB030]|uniref:SRPBCC family protein n=1 Tax=unclassified Corallococcus TaxID=2685029 RepID=UPI000EA2EBDC|nr:MULTISPECIES: SRPBCC family protein [unclassified Corallococcus]RKH21680.1 SRPBCC family protein [Corallococcus sp. CA041A]RKI13437.1 SRPBCC family protein [Corallococcus sp. AB030]
MLHQLIGAQFRTCVERDYEGKPAHVVVAQRVYPTTIEDLWDAVTNAERIPRWFAPVEGQLQKGGRYQIKGNAGGTITRCDKPSAFDLTWEMNGGMSWVTIRLAPEGKGTRLTLEHIVHSADVEQFWSQFGPGATGVGWDLSFLGLGMYLETGKDVAAEAAASWGTSDEAKTFMRASAQAWADAHVAGGEAPDVARGMAERTAAFYTGG